MADPVPLSTEGSQARSLTALGVIHQREFDESSGRVARGRSSTLTIPSAVRPPPGGDECFVMPDQRDER
jgi:hypothetical protein